MLEVKDLHCSYGTTQVLKGVDLNVNKGEVISILGSSGSGKTTLLRCISFLQKADSGSIRFDDFEKDIIERIRYAQKTGKRHFIVVVAEGVGHSEDICKRIQEETGIESRATILGHVQRGGSPTLRDRVVASRMGYHAVELLRDDKSNRVVVMQGERIVDFDITEALEMPRVFDEKLYKISQDLSR